MRSFFSLMLTTVPLFLLGCTGAVETTPVTGTVTIGGKPANCGSITFAGPQNYVASGYIQQDGTYEIGNVPLGEVTVTIAPARPIIVPGEANADPLKPLKLPPPRAIPTRYAGPDNGLAFTVTANMTKDFDLKR